MQNKQDRVKTQNQIYLFIYLYICLFVYLFSISLCTSGCSGTHYVDQADLELTELYLPLELEF